MNRTTSTRSRSTVVAGLATAGLVLTGAAVAAPAAQAATYPPVNTSSLISLEQMAVYVKVDTLASDVTGNQTLLSASRTDKYCLSDKTMRAITGAKPAPEPGTAKAYVEGLYTSTANGNVAVQESLAQAGTLAEADGYLSTMRQQIKQCTPPNGHHYGRGQTVKTNTGTLTYYVEYNKQGIANGGAAVLDSGERFGYVDLTVGGPETLRTVAVAASNLIYGGQCGSSVATANTVRPNGC